MVKGKIIELVVMIKEEWTTSTKSSKRCVLGFYDSEKVEGVSNKIFPMVITSVISKFSVSRILIDGGSYYYIMYSDIF